MKSQRRDRGRMLYKAQARCDEMKTGRRVCDEMKNMMMTKSQVFGWGASVWRVPTQISSTWM